LSEEVAPKGWCVATIMDVAASSGGGTPSKSDPSYWDEGTIPWVSPKDMKSFLVTSSEDSVTTKALARLTLIPSESVLVVVRSGILSRTLPVSINKIPVTVNQDMRAFVPAGGIDARYIAWQLVSKERDILDRCAKDGTTVASIEGPALATYPMAIAPLNEQTRIVEKLEELLSDLDAGVAELKAAQRKLAQYRQSLLKAAVEGALTADWRAARAQSGEPQETGAALLQRILTERRTRWESKQLAKFAEQGKTPPKDWKAKYSEPIALDTTNLPALPEGWVWTSLDALVAESSYGTSVKCGYESDETPVLRIPNVSAGKLNLHDMKCSIQTLSLDEDDYLSVGDVLVIRTNGSIGLVGRAAAVTEALPTPHYFASYLLRLRCVDRVFLHRWISSVLAAHAARRWLEARAASSAGQHNISLSTLLTMPVPLPPKTEQVYALDLLANSMEQCDEQEEALSRSVNQSVAQRKNILKAAFAGQLVPQHPNDEPASALLERIRAERDNPEHASTRSRRMKQPKRPLEPDA